MSGRMQDKVVLVLGAGSVGAGWGNGRAISVRMVQEGASVNKGAEPAASSSAELGTLLRNDSAKWTKVIRDKNIKGD